MKKIICILLLLCFGLSACSDKGDNEASEVSSIDENAWKYGGTITLASVPVDTMNPLITKHASVSDFLSLVYEGLFACKSDHTIVPVLAESYSVSDNNTTYTIKLKDNIKFHNGKAFTSADVVATLDYIFMYDGNYSSLKNNILLYQATSPDSVSIILKSPIADFVNCLDFPILPANHTADDFVGNISAFVPVGTGMYAYDNSEGYKNIYLKSNENWHGEKKPYISQVDVQILADADTIIAAFDAGVIDALTTSWTNPAEINLSSAIFKTYKTEQNRFTFLGINCACAYFDTPEERRYLSLAIDSNQLAGDIMLENGVAANAPLRDGIYFDTGEPIDISTLEVSPLSIEEKTEIMLLYNSDSKTKERLANNIKYQLENNGYTVILDGKPFNEYISKVGGCEYDIYVGEVNIDNSGNLEFMLGENRNGQNICPYKSQELVNFISNLNRASTKDGRAAVWNNFKKYYSETAFQIPIYFTNGCTYLNKNVQGDLSPNLSNFYSGFENLYVNTK